MRKTQQHVAALGIAILAVASAAALGTLSFIGNKTQSIVTDPTGRNLAGQPVAQMARQGWGFFTRDAREDILGVSTWKEGSWQELTQNRMSSAENLYGLSRKARAIEQDIGAIAMRHEVAEGWSDCSSAGRVSSCIKEQSTEPVVVELTPVDEALCGPLLMTRTPPTPLAFAQFDADPPIRYVTVEVEC